MKSRRIIGPINRVEGDLSLKIEINEGKVSDAFVTSSLFRGFEEVLKGKSPLDALVFAPRICGICSISQSLAAASALRNLQEIEISKNGEICQNLLSACENMADHLTHFYIYFMPDFANKAYEEEAFYKMGVDRFKAKTGTAFKDFLPARAEFMNIMGIMAGKWPHSLAIRPGGVSKTLDRREINRLKNLIYSFKKFIEDIVFGVKIDAILDLKSNNDLINFLNSQDEEASDFIRFMNIAKSLKLDEIGNGYDNFLSYGAYQQYDSSLFERGLYVNGNYSKINNDEIYEDSSYSFLLNDSKPKLHPFDGQTIADMETKKHGAYSHCKAPRIRGEVFEVGALARQFINKNPLISDLIDKTGSNVKNRIIARLYECAILIVQMEKWVNEIDLTKSFCNHDNIPDNAMAYGQVEAARGSLGHWVVLENGLIKNYQIIAPTTWNFSPRDSDKKMGVLEKALINAPVRDAEDNPISVQHIIRSFDPCMVCTVH